MMHVSIAVPDWAVAAAVAAGQARSDEPAAVIGAGGGMCANAWARASGVRIGMRKREALSLCPELIVLARDPHRDALRFEAVLRAIDAYVAHVVLIEPGRVLFPARGAVRAVGSMEILAEALVGHIADVAGCEAHIGCGQGTLAALLAAQSDAFLDAEESLRFLARTRVEKMLVGVAPAGRPEARTCLELLEGLGVRTVGGVSDLGAAAMVSRFGEIGSLLWQLATGHDVHVPNENSKLPSIVCSRVFEPPLERAEEAVFSARGLADELVEAIGPRMVASGRLHIDGVFDSGEELSRSWSVGGGSARDIVDRVRWQLGGWVGDSPLVRLELRLENVPTAAAPEALWGGRCADDERASGAVARIQAVLGEESVRVPHQVGGRTMEERCAEIAWGEHRSELEGRAALPWPGAIPEPGPTRVHTNPVDIELEGRCGHQLTVTGEAELACAAGGEDPEPGKLRSSESTAAIHNYAGPWPIDQRWWNDSLRSRRAYLQIVLDRSAVLVYREGSAWHEEGRYE